MLLAVIGGDAPRADKQSIWTPQYRRLQERKTRPEYQHSKKCKLQIFGDLQFRQDFTTPNFRFHVGIFSIIEGWNDLQLPIRGNMSA